MEQTRQEKSSSCQVTGSHVGLWLIKGKYQTGTTDPITEQDQVMGKIVLFYTTSCLQPFTCYANAYREHKVCTIKSSIHLCEGGFVWFSPILSLSLVKPRFSGQLWLWLGLWLGTCHRVETSSVHSVKTYLCVTRRQNNIANLTFSVHISEWE